jgi:hypothetical protein
VPGVVGVVRLAGSSWPHGIVGMLNMVALWWLEADRGPVGRLADQLAELVWSGIRADG